MKTCTMWTRNENCELCARSSIASYEVLSLDTAQKDKKVVRSGMRTNYTNYM